MGNPDVRINADDSDGNKSRDFRVMDHEITFTEPINHRPLYRKIRSPGT